MIKTLVVATPPKTPPQAATIQQQLVRHSTIQKIREKREGFIRTVEKEFASLRAPAPRNMDTEKKVLDSSLARVSETPPPSPMSTVQTEEQQVQGSSSVLIPLEGKDAISVTCIIEASLPKDGKERDSRPPPTLQGNESWNEVKISSDGLTIKLSSSLVGSWGLLGIPFLPVERAQKTVERRDTTISRTNLSKSAMQSKFAAGEATENIRNKYPSIKPWHR